MEFRHIGIGIDLPILGIHQQNGYRLCPFLFHDLFRCLLGVHLDILIQTDVKVISGHRLHPALSQFRDFHAPGVCGGKDLAVNAPQHIFIHDFQSHDSLIVPAGEAQHLGRQIIVGVISFKIFIDFYPVQMVAPYFIPHRLFHIGLYPLNGGNGFHPLLRRLF